ncbi:hypothetical protein M1328_02135 [Patescibacteria group bacterium]|nr:hypothetical protein [Patescibacteria group bacterium]
MATDKRELVHRQQHHLGEPEYLPPRQEKSKIRRNYSPLNLLRRPKEWGGVEVDERFSARHMSQLFGVDSEKIALVHHVSQDLPSFVNIGLGNLKEDSPLRKKLTEVHQNLLIWLDEWVAPKDSNGVKRDDPIYRQVYDQIKKVADTSGTPFEGQSFLQRWWEDLTFLRFLMAKGSVGSIMMNRQNGVETSTFGRDLIDALPIDNLQDEKLLKQLIKIHQGPDLDFAVFPTDVYQEVFEEFFQRGILRKALGRGIKSIGNLEGDEKEKYVVGKLTNNDISLPAGFKLKTGQLICAYSEGNIKQKEAIPYRDIVYYTDIIDEKTGKTFNYRVAAMEFMPSTADETTIDEDSRTGPGASLLSQLRSSGVFLVNGIKKFPPTWLEPSDWKKLKETGFVAKLDSAFAEALTLPDIPFGNILEDMVTGKTEFDHSLIATLVGRSLRDGLLNSLNIADKNFDRTDFIGSDYSYIFRNLSPKFKPESVKQENLEEMQTGLLLGWLTDFPRFISFLEETGFAKHLVLGQDPEIFKAIVSIADKIRNRYRYPSFVKILNQAKKEGIKKGKAGKIEGDNLKRMVDQNFSRVIELIRKDDRIPGFFKEGRTDLELISELLKMPIFRELPREKSWGTNLDVNVIDGQNLRQHLVRESTKLSRPIFGYRFYERGASFVYHMTRYPRTLKYNIGSVEDYRMAASDIVEEMKLGEPVEDKPTKETRFRIVLGLNEGYNKDKKMPLGEVKAFLGDRFSVKNGVVITANTFLPNSRYEEDVLIIEGNVEDMGRVFTAADLTGQERFAVELLDKQEAYIVETRHCQYSDLNFQQSVSEIPAASVVNQA